MKKLLFYDYPEFFEKNKKFSAFRNIHNENKIMRLYQKANPFFIVPGFADHNASTLLDMRSELSELDLPFQTVWFEKTADFSVGSIEISSKNGHVHLIHINYVLVNEVSPKEYEFVVGLQNITIGETNNILYVDSKNDYETHRALVHMLKYLLEKLNKSEIGAILTNKKIKYNYNGAKCIKNVNKIIICGQKKDVEKLSHDEMRKPVDWSHQWEVRGHWRNCSTIGKNREGEYCISGFTWIKNHVKGEGILIKKARVFQSHAKL